MAANRTRVVGPVGLPDGSTAPDGAILRFVLPDWDRDGTNVIAKGRTETTVAGGEIDVNLWRTAAGGRSLSYDVSVIYHNDFEDRRVETYLGKVALTGPGPVTLAAILALPAPVPDVPDALAQTLAAAEAVKDMARDADRVRADRIAAETYAAEAGGYAAGAAFAGNWFDSIALGRAAVADGQTFGVKAGLSDGLLRPTVYQRTSASTQDLVVDPARGTEIDGLDARLAPVVRSVTGAEERLENMYTGEMTGGRYPIAGGETAAVMWWDSVKQSVDAILKRGTGIAGFMEMIAGDWARSLDADLYAAEMTGPRYPLLAVGSNNVPLGWYDASTDEVVIPKLNGGGTTAPSYPRPARVALPDNLRFALNASTIYGHISYGQSLSIGAQGGPALTISQPFANVTFAAGPKTTRTGNGFGGQNQSAMSLFGPLVEDNLSPDANAARGETVCSGTVNGAVELALVENGLTPSQLVMFASACGKGGEPIANLVKDAAPETSEVPGATENYYQNFLDHVTQATAIAASLGKDFVLATINWTQGEANSGTTAASYKATLTALIADMQADVMAITGQDTPPHILFSQQGSGAAQGTTGGPAQAMFELARDRDDCHLCGPIYHLPFASDGTHLTNVGYARLGRYFARAVKSILVDGLKPLTLRPVSATLRGAAVHVRFEVPNPPLLIDSDALAATTDAGFAVTSSSGTSTITSITVAADGVTLILGLSALPGTDPVLRCGVDHLGAGLNINNGGSTNLRDSTADRVLIGAAPYQTWNVAPHVRLPIIKIN